MANLYTTHLDGLLPIVRTFVLANMVAITCLTPEANSQPGSTIEVTSNEFRFNNISAAEITYNIGSIIPEIQSQGGIFSLQLVPSATGLLSINTPGLTTYEECTTATCPGHSKTQPVVSSIPQGHIDGKTVYRIRARALITNSEGAPIYVDSVYPSIQITSAVFYLRGDYNYDGIVNAADYTVWRDTLGSQQILADGADGSGNGTIDSADYSMWRSRFGQFVASSSSTATAIPEPSTLTLLVVVGLTSIFRGRFGNRWL